MGCEVQESCGSGLLIRSLDCRIADPRGLDFRWEKGGSPCFYCLPDHKNSEWSSCSGRTYEVVWTAVSDENARIQCDSARARNRGVLFYRAIQLTTVPPTGSGLGHG